MPKPTSFALMSGFWLPKGSSIVTVLSKIRTRGNPEKRSNSMVLTSTGAFNRSLSFATPPVIILS